MAKKAIEFTMVDQLTGRISVSVSGGTEGKADYVPETDGFIIEVRYDSESQKMGKALSSTRIDVQNILRTFYRANKRFPFAVGKVQKVSGTGTFELPVASQVDRLEVQASQGLVSTADLIRIAKAAGMSIPADWLAMAEAPTVDDDGMKPAKYVEMKYPEGSLDKVVIGKLKIIAQGEELEGYDELTADELRAELYAIEK